MIWRMTAALLLSLGVALAVGPWLIRRLKKLHFGTVIYDLGPAHQQKQGTPVMGGLMIALLWWPASFSFIPGPGRGSGTSARACWGSAC